MADRGESGEKLLTFMALSLSRLPLWLYMRSLGDTPDWRVTAVRLGGMRRDSAVRAAVCTTTTTTTTPGCVIARFSSTPLHLACDRAPCH